MIRLQLLGGVRLLDGDGHDIRAVMQQPKRLAVLAFLAVARPRGPQRRDVLVGLFWAESDEVSARRSLSQSLYFLRQKIHGDLFAGRFGEEVGLRESELWCDVVAFEEALDAGHTAEALALYGGDLLPGFHVSDAPEWEKWLDLERDRLRNRAAQAAWSLAAAEEEASHAGAAAHWARWAVALSPYDEKQHCRMLELLVRMGDRAGALRAHDDFARRLATEFEIEPAPETNALVAAIRQDAGGAASGEMVARAARGLERRAEPVAEAPSRTEPAETSRDVQKAAKARRLSDASTSMATATSGHTGEHSGRRWRLRTNRRIAVAAIVIALASAAYVGVKVRTPRSSLTSVAPEQPLNRIGIMPFRDLSPDSELGYFAEGLATTLTDRLADVERLAVVSTSATRQFASRSVPMDSVGRALNVGSMVAASVSRSGDELRVLVELIDARNGTTLATETLQREQGDMFVLLDSIASSVAWMLRTELGQEIQLRDWNRETESVRAWELVQMSREARASSSDQERAAAHASLTTALQYTDDAIDLDPQYVQAYIERSRTFQTLLQYHLDDPARTLAILDSAEISAGRAISMDANSAEALEQRANMQYFSWLFDDGQDGQNLLALAESDLRSALEIDPHRARSEALLSQILYQRGEFRQAYDAANRAYRADAYAERVEDVLWRLFETSFELGNDDEAAKWCDELRRRVPESWLQHQCELTLLAFGASGEADVRKSLLALDAARRRPRIAENAIILNQFTALVGASYARAGQPDSARAVLNRTLSAAPADPTVKYTAAAALLRMGDRDRAIELIRDYLAALPNRTDQLQNSRLFAALDQEERMLLLLPTDTR